MSCTRSSPAAGAPRRRRDGWALLGICLGFFVVLLDATVVNVALPAISRSLGGSLAAEQWTLNAYTVTFAAFMVTGGALGDRWGARRCYLTGLLVFAGATAVCAAAPTIAVLVAARAIQGIGAAALVPCSLSLIADRFAEGPQRARALGAWGGISGLGLTAGPVVGGLLVDAAGWRLVFLIAVPVAIVSAVLVATTVEEASRRAAARADPGGQLLAVLALAALTGALTTTTTYGWTAWPPLALAAVGVLAAIGLLATERHVPHPMLGARLFANARFSAATGIGALFNFGLYGSLFCLALYIEQTLDHSARATGLLLAPLTAVVTLFALLSGRINARFGPGPPMLIGLGAGAIAAGLLAAIGAGAPTWLVVGGGALLGVVGLAMPAMTSVALDAAPAGRAGLGSAVLNAARQTGGAFGVALLGSVLTVDANRPSLHVAMAIAAAGYLVAALIASRLRPA